MKFFFIIQKQKCHSDQLKLAAQNLEDGEIKRSRLIIRKRHIARKKKDYSMMIELKNFNNDGNV